VFVNVFFFIQLNTRSEPSICVLFALCVILFTTFVIYNNASFDY
jgi:heme/copper-type cytochrome/quinol oxidase subunit 4